jgi:peptide-methionine (S)-S-oxide reductase
MKISRFEIRPRISAIALLFALSLTTGMAAAQARVTVSQPFPDPPSSPAEKGVQTAVFAGGCFWGIEGVFERLKGVSSAVSGYAGGTVKNPSYEQVSTGTTGHAESVMVTYDPAVIGYGTLLKVFFSVAHDPTELDFQGPDHGTQYRSAIFFRNDIQKAAALAYIAKLDSAGTFHKKLVTEVVPFEAFYPAEAYHQHFLDNNPDYPYIVYWDLPKIDALARYYPQLVAKK